MTFVRFTGSETLVDLWVNPHHVVLVREGSGGTLLRLTNDIYFTTPEDITAVLHKLVSE